MSLSGLVASAPQFVPNDDSREWIATGVVELAGRLGPAASQPRLLTDGSNLGFGTSRTPRNLDGLFDMICAVQEQVGQAELELTLLEIDDRGAAPKLPDGYVSLGDSRGKLLHTLRGPDEYLLLFTPAVFKVRELMLASIARELGRIGLDRAGALEGSEVGPDPERLLEWEADSELAAILLGMGIWVANGAYLFENACCGGGCGVDLRSLRTGLSLPEACYALALDSQRKGIRRWSVVRHLAATQKAATKKCWSHLGDTLPPALAAATPEIRGALRG
ncbi:MAG TPA: hypothetical protein VM869_22200 [Enhygromyxa sp.]|nr:hypothetical protein [Enhygromyxa sp.]